jgi:GTP-binding protein Era
VTTRAGFVGLAGRPNVGKSTLANAIVGAKVAIVSDRPQTTRRAVRGIATDPGGAWQMVLVDLPGVQRPRDDLTQRMQPRVEQELGDADAVLLVVDCEQGVGPGDRFIARALIGAGAGTPVVCAVNKVDRARKPAIAKVLVEVEELGVADEIFPVSAKRGTGIAPLVDRLVGLLPEGPLLYPPQERTDAVLETRVAELIREQVLRRTREEIPHAVEVMVTDIERREDGLVEVHAEVWAETESQKGILVGRGGKMVRDVGAAARRELERELGARVYLELQVRVRRHWRRDAALLDRLGIE